ncbi:peptidylprolyl isomerase [Synechococcus sp. MU1643]|nr:peptidylprolyl isomerase [Synechococcus sp. MU1643]
MQNLSPETLALLRRHNLLQPLVRAEILGKTVESIELSTEQRDQIWNNFKAKNKLDTTELFETYLKNNGLKENDLRWQLELPTRIQIYSQEHFQHKAEARFLARKEQLDQVFYSLLRLQDRHLARELYLRISGGEANFADLAANYSQGPEAKTKGVVGPVSMTQSHPALSERLRTSQPGQLLQPFQVDKWWLIVRLERYEAAQFDDNTRQRMAQELFQEWLNQELLSKVRSLD